LKITQVNQEIPVILNGEQFWTIKQFSRLTGRSAESIRSLIIRGNRIRRLKCCHFEDRPYVIAKELFDFPFTDKGRPSEVGFFIYRYKLEDGELVVQEEVGGQDEA
jgi:hypothetical protein